MRGKGETVYVQRGERSAAPANLPQYAFRVDQPASQVGN